MKKILVFILVGVIFSYSFFSVAQIAKSKPSKVLGTNHTQEPIRNAKGNSDGKFVALTFDDGPTPNTIKVLNVLQESDIKATFFVVGENIDEFPGALKKIDEQGHEIGNHTNTHPFTVFMSEQDIAKEILITEEKIFQLIGKRTTLFRAPYALYPSNLMKIAGLLNLNIISWDVDPEDWRNSNAEIISQNVIKEVEPGSIILLHDGPPELDRTPTVEALKIIITELKNANYQFVTVTELLEK